MIQVKDLHKYYGDLHVLKGIDLSIKQGEIVTIVGPSWAGKTTLLQILGTLDSGDKGDVYYDQTNPFTFKQQKLARFRNDNIGFVFQFHQLLPEFTAIEGMPYE